MKTKVTEETLVSIKKEIASLNTDQVLIVVDSRVWQLYSKELEKGLSDTKNHILFKALEGENSKSFKEFENGLEYFLEKGVHRGAHLISIGGGTTSDFAGFLASSLLRGISWSAIPTTLLGMVDASIGGKTGINSKHGKNLVGAFHLPEHVWLDVNFLETLAETEMSSGKGEVIKYAFLSKPIAKAVKEAQELKDLIRLCAQEKQTIVEEDFKEKGSRIALNLGHTFGHALEKIYDLPHGVAVFWGMGLVFKFFGEDKYLEDLRTFEKGIGANFGAPPWLNKTFPVAKIMDFVSKDKKMRKDGMIEFVLVEEIGKFKTQLLSLSDCSEKLEGMKDELRSFTF
jgi:3-dehydroquinate synthase